MLREDITIVASGRMGLDKKCLCEMFCRNKVVSYEDTDPIPMLYALQRLRVLFMQVREGRVRNARRAKNSEGHFWDVGTPHWAAAVHARDVRFLSSPLIHFSA